VPSATASKLGNRDWESVSEPLEVTAVSRTCGTQGIQEDTGGAAGIRKDTTYGRFGTVRPRVQIPGPRPVSEYRFSSSPEKT